MEVKLCKNVAQGACLTATRESWVEVDAHLHQRVGFCENICPVFSTTNTLATAWFPRHYFDFSCTQLRTFE